MGRYFGTDGIRGAALSVLTHKVSLSVKLISCNTHC